MSESPPIAESSERATRLLVFALALVGFGLRVFPFFRDGGALSVPSNYDDGVYFGGAAWLARGVIPYRDFAFVHPPGVMAMFLPAGFASSWIGVDGGFALARWMAAAVGFVNVLLVARVSGKVVGPVAAVVAAALYAVFPEAVMAERSVYTEPGLILCCLLVAAVLAEGALTPKRIVWLCLGLGAALSFKAWAMFWALPVGLVVWRFWGFRRAVLVGVGSVAAYVLLVSPIALLSPGDFVAQTIGFHMNRPPDGMAALATRALYLADGHRISGWALAVFGLVAFARDAAARRQPALLLAALAYPLVLAVFLLSKTYWSQYNAFLAPAECLLAGFGAAKIFEWVRSRWRVPAFALAVALVVIAFPSYRRSVMLAKPRATEEMATAKALRELVPPSAEVFAFEPAWAIRAGFLQREVDTYALFLLRAAATGEQHATLDAAVKSAPVQETVKGLLQPADAVVLGLRGREQLDSKTMGWFQSGFELRKPEANDVWRRR